MILQHLSILNYKNIAQAELDLSPNVNCFIGSNGEGKTNLLDAVHYLSMCKSANCNQDSMIIRHDEPFLMVQGRYIHEDGMTEVIHGGVKRGQKKIFRRGDKPYKRLTEHIGLIPLVIISPSDSILVAGGSEERRRFLDMVICQYDAPYMEALMRYDKALQQRNAMLKMEEEPDIQVMMLWEEQMAREGEHIYRCRKDFIERLAPIFQQYYSHIAQGHETVELRYTSHCQRGPLLDVIQRDRLKDRAIGYSLHGIHRDDIEMTIDGYPLRREGSQGQSKTYLIALKLAQFDFLRQSGTGTTPLLLLDDIFDKLDAKRVEQIVKLVSSEEFGQIFVTDTNRDHLDQILACTERDYRLFYVKNGEIAQ